MLTYLIKPQQISLQTIRNEIANTLHIAVARIKRFEYWPHQLWVHIEGVGGRIVSYRSLPTYLYQAFLAVKNCRTLEQLWELGQLFKLETERLPQYYPEEEKYINKLRSAWAYKRDDLRITEKLEAPMKQHQQNGQKWLESWQEVIANCRNIELLQSLYLNIEDQSQEFADLPEVINQLLTFYQRKRQELTSKPFFRNQDTEF